MASRKRLRQLFSRKKLTGPASGMTSESQPDAQPRRSRSLRRQNLLETLEPRHLMAGPQLIGIQPNEGELIVDGTVLNIAPRQITVRFDENQQLDPATLAGIQITRGGPDKILGNADDVRVSPGLVTLGDLRNNEVVVRFNETLPDDRYQIQVNAVDDTQRGIVALRNEDGDAFLPATAGARNQSVSFSLQLGALVQAVVPQPVVRLADGKLEQRPNEVMVYFNEDPLFVENDPATGQPTARSAENPRFYQLLLTQETVRTTDDLLFSPTRVIYDSATHTARLQFASNINTLPGVPLGGGTFRLRIGSAVDTRTELILPTTNFAVSPSVTSNLRINSDLAVTFRSKLIGEAVSGRQVRFINTGTAGLSVAMSGNDIVFNLGGSRPTVEALANIVTSTPAVDAVLSVSYALAGVAGQGGTLVLPANITSSPALVMTAVGDTITTSLSVGTFGDTTTSLTFRESISPQPFLFDLPGSTSDVGRLRLPESVGNGLLQTINANFGVDDTAGITEIPFNFKSVFETVSGVAQLNQITELFKTRIREALSLWANYLGIQFRETASQGITFAVGDNTRLQTRPNTQLTSPGVLNASLRIDPTFTESALVFSNQVTFNTAYGEDLFRKSMAGIGFLLGLEQSTDLTAQSLMSLNSGFLNLGINALSDSEPSFPGNYDILHGQVLYRPDSIDADLYRFEVNLGSDDRVGTLTAETFAERLPDASTLDTNLTLFKEERATLVTDLGMGSALAIKLTSQQPGALGNNARIDFLRTDRVAGDTAIKIRRSLDDTGKATENGLIIDVPRRNSVVSSVTITQLINAINNDPIAATLFRAELQVGSATTDISGLPLLNPLLLSGGGLVQVARNDDYFSEDSFLKMTLSNGIYYVGVAASGNDSYDPTIANSGFGGTTQGLYQLLLKFEPQANESDTIRDLDSSRPGVPGTALDGNNDGTPGGSYNFWFQTRPLDRTLEFTGNGSAVTPGQTFTITGANGVVRQFEFVPLGGTAAAGNVPVSYNPGATAGGSGSATPAPNLAAAVRTAINSVEPATGVRATLLTGRTDVLTLSGERSFQTSAGFRGLTVHGRTIFVDKAGSVEADGSRQFPFNNISNPNVPNAFGASLPGDIVRIVGNGGSDRNDSTATDNFSYKIGTAETGGGTLEDGRNMQVPRDVTVMVDAGAVFKLRNSAITVGSTSLTANRSGGVLQVLGTPRLIDLNDPVIVSGTVTNKGVALKAGDGSVVFTSTRDRSVDAAAAGNSAAPTPGNWGGLIFARDFDQAEGRSDLEDEGIFLQTVNHADIRYGGGANILIESVQQAVNPIQMVNLRPNVLFNKISNSANAAMSAAPDSFEETSYQEPRFQAAGSFTADYNRVGPDVKRNLLNDNSINGLFVRVTTTSATAPKRLTVAGRFDDIDVVHYIAENVIIAGTPGGSIQDGIVPDVSAVAAQGFSGGSLTAGAYEYRVTFVDEFGFESLASVSTTPVTVTANSSVTLVNLPPVNSTLGYVSRRVYRRLGTGNFRLAGELDARTTTFVDDGSKVGAVLDNTRAGIRGRLDGSLVVDPGTIVKLTGTRIELGQGTQLLAEGTQSLPVVFTSVRDDRFGAGGSFDTNNDNETAAGAADPARGDWSGIYAGPTANVSFDHATIAFGGGVSLLEGGQSRGFAALELQQADGRITNSTFESNADAQLGAALAGRNGRLTVTPATIFARYTQPVIVGNTFIDNRGSIIDIDSESLRDNLRIDLGRQTGSVDRLADLDDNYGPLVRRNTTSSVEEGSAALGGQLNGMEIRGGVLSSGSIWDDTDIVHVLFDSITVGNLLSNTGLQLRSRPDESLVVKLSGAGDPNSPTNGTGFTATGNATSLSDRLGGTIHVLGLPGAPVVMTSLRDDTVGAGRTLTGRQQTDTNGDYFATRPMPNDWRSVFMDQYSNDRNVAVFPEQELSTAIAPGLNGSVSNAQFLGQLAANFYGGDEQLRLGFQVEGFLSGPADIDTYSFTGTAGTPIWLDIDKTTYGLDTVIEVLDSDGNVIARSNNSQAEVVDPTSLTVRGPLLSGKVGSLNRFDGTYDARGTFGQYKDFGTINTRDAGLSLTLPGQTGQQSGYLVRVRSASINPGDAQGGLTKGAYSLQIRLREAQEFAGSVVRFADIRYANQGIHLQGLPSTSPLVGEVGENEIYGSITSNDLIVGSGSILGQRAQFVGNLSSTKTGPISIAGSLETASDVDFYQFTVDSQGLATGAQLQKAMTFDVDYADGLNRPDANISVFFDDGSGPRLVLFGEDSNIADDQTGPLTEELFERLARGSVASGDSFIGPVSLIQGTYYVAITESGRVPTELINNPLVRRQPLDSIQRIFDDKVESSGGATATAPLFPSFVQTTTPGWSTTLIRSSDPGHEVASTFNRSTVGASYPGSIQLESEPNSSLLNADDLELAPWSIAADANIGSIFENTSQLIPHTTVTGNIGGEIADVFRFNVANFSSTVLLDIDNGFNPSNPAAAGSVDLRLQLFRIVNNGGVITYQTVGTNSSSPAFYGAGGSAPGTASIPSSSFSEDPFIQTTLTPGEYLVAVVLENATFDATNNNFTLGNNVNPPTTGNYTLHVSVANHDFGGGSTTNESYYFDRSDAQGVLQSPAFDLRGYDAADLPRFYFSHYYAPSDGDNVRIVAYSDQQPTPFTLLDDLTEASDTFTWRQSVVSLERFAGNSGVVIQFIYDTNVANASGEGLYLDNFIVGFAERGEIVTQAGLSVTGFTAGTATGQPGEYQLEMRPATQYLSTDASGVTLTSTFDTNARQARQVTLVAPAGNQIQAGDRFMLNDGAISLSFEFNNSTSFNPSVIYIPFAATDSAVQIANRIIDVINSPVVQTGFNVEASSGSSNRGLAATDARVNLHGIVTGSFQTIATVANAPATITGTPRTGGGRDIQIPAILNGGEGDVNFLRTQGQVIIDSNRLSDIRGIGIWSEPAPRPTDARDDQANSYMLAGPLGNTASGVAINLPVLNNSVLGGLTPSLAIVNNVIDQASFAGVKIDGQTQPYELVLNSDTSRYTQIDDGDMLIIDAAGTRVVFEFDDVGGATTPAGGSGVTGGNGHADGHIPIYFRHRSSAGVYNGRGTPSTVDEISVAIKQAIDGSILVTNNLARLVKGFVSPAVSRGALTSNFFISTATPAVYVEGASNMFMVGAYATLQRVPLAEAPQPFARVVNNTIYGADGREGQFEVEGTVEPNDRLVNAVDTKLGRSHRGPYLTQATLGDANNGLSPDLDVDLYQVNLDAGDRLVADINTLAGGPATALRLFDSNGVAQQFLTNRTLTRTVSVAGPTPGHLAMGTQGTNGNDSYLDFTATKKGTYYLGVSSSGNDSYDALSFSGRQTGGGGTGAYQLGLEVFAPRTFVLSVDDNVLGGTNLTNTGTRGSDLIGTTFTITQVPDITTTNGATVNGNRVTFQFTNNQPGIVNGNVAVPLDPAMRVQDIIRSISAAINGASSNVLANHTGGRGPQGLSGPVPAAVALSLGGRDGDNSGVNKVGLGVIPQSITGTPSNDYFRLPGYGHDLATSPGSGTSELYSFIRHVAEIEISEAAAAGGLRLTPDQATPAFANEADQLLAENGVLITQGSSSTVLNNVFINLHQSVVGDETNTAFGFGSPMIGNNQFYKAQTIVVTSNTFQFDEPRNSNIRAQVAGLSIGNPGISTDTLARPSNINGGTTDFNQIAPTNAQLVVNAGGDRFLPSSGSLIIDNAVDSLIEREQFAALKRSVGIPISNILAPNRDNSGQLRADDPDTVNAGGLGENVFKDRGALDRADFVGPAAIIEVPQDNDAEGIDTDPAESFLQLNRGVYDEFRIQLRDTGDTSDPFVGSGIDDNTVVVPAINGLRSSGAAVALFEGDRLLTEGVDYTFSYDATKNIIILRPIAGLWRSDRAYRVSINNRDRLVGVAPAAGQIADGDSFTVVDSNGGRVNFEYDSGYQLIVPEILQMTVPANGSGTAAISDGDLFRITDAAGNTVVFELNSNTIKLPGTTEVRFSVTDSPATVATAIRAAIQAAATANLIDVSVDTTATGSVINIGSDAGSILDTSTSGLLSAARTLGIQIPASGSGIADGDLITINDGSTTVTFEFELGGGLNNPNNTPIALTGAATVTTVLESITNAIAESDLKLTPESIDNTLFLGLPANGFVNVTGSAMTRVGISRTPVDGEELTFTTAAGLETTFELTTDDEVALGNLPINFNRLMAADQFASVIAAALKSQSVSIEGLDQSAIQSGSGGVVSIGGEGGLLLELTATSSLRVIGSPDVTSSTLLTIFGPLLLQVPIVGGTGIPNNSEFSLTDGTNTVNFIFNVPLTAVSNLTATPINYQSFEDSNTIATRIVAAINNSILNINAVNLGNGQISLGRIGANQYATPAAPAIPAPLSPRRGIVNDGERVVITQGTQTLTFEFEQATGGGGVGTGSIPVVFPASGTVDDVANILAAAINSNRGSLDLTATSAEGGLVRIADNPLTTTTIVPATIGGAVQEPTITISGTPGGAVAVPFTANDSADKIKRSILQAINGASSIGKTTLVASDRGGSTFFIENGQFIEGSLSNYFLRGVKDLTGQLLEPNRPDNSTQFTLLLPTIGLDYGDAPDPVNGVAGRYPTSLANDGPRHVVSDQVQLGQRIDVDANGQPNAAANGDDTTMFIGNRVGTLFVPTMGNGFVNVDLNIPASIQTAEGNLFTISTGVSSVTFELDSDGIFAEQNYPVTIDASGTVTRAALLQALVSAVGNSPLNPADVIIHDPNSSVSNDETVRIINDDEDGVVFASESNPTGVLNRFVPTPIEVYVTGTGVLEAWVDFNFDGDFNDPGEQIISRDTAGADFSNATGLTPLRFTVNVPATAPVPTKPTTTYARFRVSAEGGLSPTGLALSGEVEDYAITILPGAPPTVDTTNSVVNYSVDEDTILQARDADGTLTPGSANDNGTLARVRDPNGDTVNVFRDDVGVHELQSPAGDAAGTLSLFADGTFSFTPAPDFFGNAQFTFRVTDIKSDASTQLVSPVLMTMNLTVRPVNDRPFFNGTSTSITRTVAEDQVTVFSLADLTRGYTAGPANESAQRLVIQSAGVNGLGFQSQLGGSLTILANGDLQYTPPANFPGPGPDRFVFVVADDPNDANQLVQSATTLGTITVNITSVNDPPLVVTDVYSGAEDATLTIPITGANGILDNDEPGPADESTQTLTLVTSEFPKITLRGGTVALGPNNTLVYTPARDFSGQDQFNYTVRDSGNPAQSAQGLVRLNIGGDNDAPVFVGIEGDAQRNSLTFDESKDVEQVFNFNLSSWFVDPEGDASTFQVTSSDPSTVRSEVLFDNASGISTLRLTLPRFKPTAAGAPVTLSIVASNVGNGPSRSVQIPVTVNDTPDPPTVIGSLDPLSAREDEVITRNLRDVFYDPDAGPLTYRVTRLGNLINPTAAQIAASPLIASVAFNGDNMQITLDANASGTAEIEISATDGSFEVRDSFVLTVAPVADAPTAQADFYNVPVGSRFEMQEPSQGLLANDSDPDDDVFTGTTRKLQVDPSSVTQPTRGTLTVSANGTFTYTNTSGETGDTDSFQYRPVDATGRVGNLVTVTFNLGRSRYQNPIPEFAEDVNANGVISPLDALRIINRISAFRRANGPSVQFTVATITTAPPDYIDVTGDGLITPLDALRVINRVAEINRNRLPSGEGESVALNYATTVAYAAPATVGLPVTNVSPVANDPVVSNVSTETYDPFAAGFDVLDSRVEQSSAQLIQLQQSSQSDSDGTSVVDEVLSDWLDVTNL